MSSPEQIQRDIEQTRASLSSDVDRLTDKVSPSQITRRRVEQVKGAANSMKERVMGSSDRPGGTSSGTASARETMGSAASSMSDAASNVGETASRAPEAIRRQTQGNPLAAGLIAFGVGWLVASLMPATEQEQQLARRAEEKAGDLTEPMKAKAQEVASNLQEPAQRAADQVKTTATQAASDTADHAKSVASDAKDTLQQ